MFCEECNNKEATVHITKIINGKKEEKNLCDSCSKTKESLNLESNFSMPNFISSIMDGNTSPNININYRDNKVCSQCGFTYEDFKKNGKLGCDKCYEEFTDMLLPLIKRVQGHTRHIGKIPKTSGVEIRIKSEINTLKNQLKDLILREAFEEATIIRDEIRSLESKLNKN